MTRRLSLLLLLLLFVFPFGLSAQDELPIDPNYTISVPNGWTWEDADIGVLLTDYLYSVIVVDPVELNAAVSIDSNDSAASALIMTYLWMYDSPIPRAQNVRDLNVPGRVGVAWNYELSADDLVGVFILLEMSDGTYGALDIYALDKDFGDPEAELVDLITSFDVASAGGSGGSGEPCRVATDQARTVALRVGPGENRTSVAFLPTGVEVDVTGVFVTADGEEWFQLDKAQAAPQSAAAELWMHRGDADEIGDCDAVGDASAPPVIPIAPVAPTAAPATGGGQAGGSEQPATGSITPTAGRWTMALNPTTNASCRGGANTAIPSTSIFSSLTGTTTLANVPGGITLDGDFLARTPGTNYFEGSITFAVGNSQIRVNFTSATFGTGSITGNVTVSGTPCSVTVAFNLSR